METKDSNGNILTSGDMAHVIKDLKVKGTSLTIKQGTKVKIVETTLDPSEVDCKVPKMKGITVLRTEFLKKN